MLGYVRTYVRACARACVRACLRVRERERGKERMISVKKKTSERKIENADNFTFL